MNVKNPEDKDKYKEMYFKHNAYDTFSNYLKNLILSYYNETSYPFTMPPALGIPLFHYALEIKSEDELLGRIKLLGQLLGVQELSFEYDKERICYFNMNGEFIIKEKE